MKSFLPAPDILVTLEPEEIAFYFLSYLNTLEPANSTFSLYNILLDTNYDIRIYLGNYTDYQKVKDVLTEAAQWLITEGYLATAPTNSAGWILITRRGRKIKQKIDFENSSYIKLFPYKNLDERLRNKVLPSYIRGEFANAVFNAFKEVEIRLRESADLDNSIFGVKLVEKTFEPQNGLLIDREDAEVERKRLYELMCGTIGTFKNPPSHRDIDYEKPIDVVGLLLFANYLLSIIEERKQKYNYK